MGMGTCDVAGMARYFGLCGRINITYAKHWGRCQSGRCRRTACHMDRTSHLSLLQERRKTEVAVGKRSGVSFDNLHIDAIVIKTNLLPHLQNYVS